MPFSAAIVECYKQIGANNEKTYFKEEVKQLIEKQNNCYSQHTVIPFNTEGKPALQNAFPQPQYSTPVLYPTHPVPAPGTVPPPTYKPPSSIS